jgi:hypothetical protein
MNNKCLWCGMNSGSLGICPTCRQNEILEKQNRILEDQNRFGDEPVYVSPAIASFINWIFIIFIVLFFVLLGPLFFDILMLFIK